MPRSRVDASAPSQPRWRALCVSTAPSVHTPREFIHHSQERYVLMEPLAKPRLLHTPIGRCCCCCCRCRRLARISGDLHMFDLVLFGLVIGLGSLRDAFGRIRNLLLCELVLLELGLANSKAIRSLVLHLGLGLEIGRSSQLLFGSPHALVRLCKHEARVWRHCLCGVHTNLWM